jgi:hypothetical protein
VADDGPPSGRSGCGREARSSFRVEEPGGHTFLTSRGHLHAEFKRALDRGNLWIAEAVARELPKVSLEDALKLVHLYAEKESTKFEKAAIKWLRRYLNEASPELSDVANVARVVERQDAPNG